MNNEGFSRVLCAHNNMGDCAECEIDSETYAAEGESVREKHIRNDAFKRGLRTAKLDNARRFFDGIEPVREAFNIWRSRARSSEGKLKKALNLLGMTEYELDSHD